MNREYDTDQLIDLGAASVQTQGSFVRDEDTENGKLPGLGLVEE